MVREWLRERNQPPRGLPSHPERWQVSDWKEVLGRCAGEEGHLLFECESVQVTKEEEISFGALFKNSKSSKNGYKTRDYKDRLRRNVAGIAKDFCGDKDPRLRGQVEFGGLGSAVGAGYADRSAVRTGARKRVTLRELEIRAADLMSGDSRSQRQVEKRLDSFLARSRDAIANLEAEVTAVLRRLGLRSRAEDWSRRESVCGRPSHKRHSR
ncbi:hypothetical protein AXG93_3037s1090 [Marchantia polymorpha subsp. ruderalis]|uniref:Uncharacterized protein n=1 Tax=Marchantia polymorpha subsp. ruderalis TaxID=1480154 RepID=A0A176WNR6_MARPO|nr:hypothetical protein AXG93_3037s1090 [Marchantia polymorpha subsp. ruderalis]